jgi:hypothetical protein
MTRPAAPAPPGPGTIVVPDQPRAAIINATGKQDCARYLQHLTDPGETARLLVQYVRTTTPADAAAALTTKHPGGWREITAPDATPGSCFCHRPDGTWNPAFVDQVLITGLEHRLNPPGYGGYRPASMSLGRSVEYAYRIEDAGLHVYAVDGAHASEDGTTLSQAAFLAWYQPVHPDTIAEACAALRHRSPRTREDELAGLALNATIASLRAVASTDDLVLHLITTTIRDKTSARAVRRALAKATGTTQTRLPAHLATLTRAEQLDLLRTVRRTLTATLPPPA